MIEAERNCATISIYNIIDEMITVKNPNKTFKPLDIRIIYMVFF